MTKAFERRMAVTDMELRDDDNGVTLTGYASTFSQPYDMGWYQETVDPEAFKRTLGSKPDVRLLINHDGLPLARTTSGTLTLDTDKRGLMATATLDPSDPDVAALVPKMKRGDLNQMSFGFRTISDLWEDDMSKRTLRELDLNNGDVSVVTYPANPHTTASVRAYGRNLEAVASAILALEARNASDDDVQAMLVRAFPSLDAPQVAASVAEIVAAGEPQISANVADDSARQSRIAAERRARMLAALG